MAFVWLRSTFHPKQTSRINGRHKRKPCTDCDTPPATNSEKVNVVITQQELIGQTISLRWQTCKPSRAHPAELR